jgi:dipeptidyl-peptidase-3
MFSFHPVDLRSFMRRILMTVSLVITFSLSAAAADEGKITALPLPKSVRVQSAGPRAKVWETLSPKDKKLAYYLVEAANAGRDLLFYQSHRHALAIKKVIEEALSNDHIQETKALLGSEPFAEFLVYAAKFSDQCGPYTPSNRKYILQKVTPEQVAQLLARYAAEQDSNSRQEIARLLTDPSFEVQEFPESPDGQGLEKTGGNLYEKGITGDEIRRALDKTLKPTLNCRVIRQAGGLECQIQTTESQGFVGETLRRVVANLEAARRYASTPHQRAQIDHMIAYFQKGDIEDFRQASIEWVKDRADSLVDFMLGWVEFEGDWLSRIASWESYVQIVDPVVSRLAQGLARRAQSFEDAMPYGAFKKHFPENYSPPAIMVYYFQEIAGLHSGGYNLPNFDDIRRDVGAKNVIRLPLPGEDTDPQLLAIRREAFRQFLPADKVEPVLANREAFWRNLVLMHEIIGHGSGTYDTSKYGATEDPVSALGNLGSALEEQRADLTALLFADSDILVQVGACKDAAQARLFRDLTYDAYLADFLLRTSRDRSFAEMHERGHWMFFNKLMEAGAIGWAARDGHSQPTLENQVVVVKDYDKFQQVARNVLEELQAIKANRDEKRLKDLFAKYAPLDGINQSWAQEMIRRGQNLAINAGSVDQPWRITSDGKYEALGGTSLESIAPYWKPQNSQAAAGQ